MTRRLRGLAAVVLLAALLTGCGPNVTEGVVSAKRFEAAHDEPYLLPICIAYGSNGLCTVTIYQLMHNYLPDRWVIWLVAQCERYPACDIDWHEVSQGEYSEAQVGAVHTLWGAQPGR
jgi:hypothetical protein